MLLDIVYVPRGIQSPKAKAGLYAYVEHRDAYMNLTGYEIWRLPTTQVDVDRLTHAYRYGESARLQLFRDELAWVRLSGEEEARVLSWMAAQD